MHRLLRQSDTHFWQSLINQMSRVSSHFIPYFKTKSSPFSTLKPWPLLPIRVLQTLQDHSHFPYISFERRLLTWDIQKYHYERDYAIDEKATISYNARQHRILISGQKECSCWNCWRQSLTLLFLFKSSWNCGKSSSLTAPDVISLPHTHTLVQ